jgi:hypothetical protein
MAATYTFDIFSTLDGYGSYGPGGDWGGYWGKHAPSFSTTALPCSTWSSGWSSVPPRFGNSWRC